MKCSEFQQHGSQIVLLVLVMVALVSAYVNRGALWECGGRLLHRGGCGAKKFYDSSPGAGARYGIGMGMGMGKKEAVTPQMHFRADSFNSDSSRDLHSYDSARDSAQSPQSDPYVH